MKKTKLIALITGAVMLFSMSAVSAGAEDAAAEEEKPIELTLDGLRRVIVTSSNSVLETDGKDVGSVNFFDHKASTGCTVALEEGENADEKTLTIYTATRVPEAVETFAMLFSGERGTILAIDVYATNDSLLNDWTQLTVERPVNKEGEFHIINITEAPEKYSFYRVDITIESGSAYTLNEILLYKDIDDDAVYYWDWENAGELEAGELPELVEVEAPKVTKKPQVGIRFSPLFGQVFGK